MQIISANNRVCSCRVKGCVVSDVVQCRWFRVREDLLRLSTLRTEFRIIYLWRLISTRFPRANTFSVYSLSTVESRKQRYKVEQIEGRQCLKLLLGEEASVEAETVTVFFFFFVQR